MSEKVILTKEQAEAIEARPDKETAVRLHAENPKGWSQPANKSLNELSLDEFIRALYIGYEVEPEFELNDYIHHTENNVTQKLDNQTKVDFINKHYLQREKIRHATPYEIAKEKERRLFASVGREPWDLKEGDVLYDKQNGFSGVVDRVADFADGETVIFKDNNWALYDNVKEEYTVACFVENRLDVKTK